MPHPDLDPRTWIAALSLCAVPSAIAFSQGQQSSPAARPSSAARVVPAPPSLNEHATVTGADRLQMSGTAPGAVAVEVSGPFGVVTTPVIDSRFRLDVPLGTNRLNRIYFTALSPGGVRSSPTTAPLIQDTDPPEIFIDFPSDGALISTQFSPATPTTDVAGRVRDMLTGFQGIDVTVNGRPATVNVGIGTNGTFFIPGVPLNQDGPTLITATASDTLGNQVTEEITVNHQNVQVGTPIMILTSGNSQQAPVDSPLADPILVRIADHNGQPFASKLVTFKVIRSNGHLSTTPGGDLQDLVQVFTDASGVAQAWWTLGSDAGFGNNRVEVTSAGILGTTTFCASALQGVPDQINVGSGNAQRAEVGSVAPEPLAVYVSDGCNGVAGLPITFTVTQGDGLVDGQVSTVVNTAVTGHAAVQLTLGPDPGNNRVVADFAGNPTGAVEFVAFGIERVPGQPTRFSGIVQSNSGQPIGGATVELTPQTSGIPIVVQTAVDGTFSIADTGGSGISDLHVDGSTATAVGGMTPPVVFPALHYEPVLVPEAANALSAPILLPGLSSINDDTTYSSTPGDPDTILTTDGVEGLEMRVKAGSMSIDGVPALDGQWLALNRVNHDDIPMPMPDGAAPPFAWTLQPAGATFDPPIEVHYPNMSGLPPGAIAYFLSFDHDTMKFEIVASGQVTEDGSQIVSDPGVGLTKAGWGCNCPPYSVTTDCENCNVSISGPDQGCAGEELTFTAVGDPAGGTYTWTGGTPVGGSSSSTYTTTFASGGDQTVGVTYVCQTPSGPVSGSDSQGVLVTSIDSVVVEAENSLTECMEGRGVTFTATVTGTVPAGAGPLEYTFHFMEADGTPWEATVVSSELTVDYDAVADDVPAGNMDHFFDTPIYVEVKCGDQAPVTSPTITVRVYELWIEFFGDDGDGSPWKVVVDRSIRYEAIASPDCTSWDWDMEDGFPDQWNPAGGTMQMGNGMVIPTSDLPDDGDWDDFGDAYGTVNVACEDEEGNSHQIESTDLDPPMKAQVFFVRGATDNPGSGDPNWYYYWSAALGVSGEHTYGGGATSTTVVNSATDWTIEIGSNADWPGGNFPTGQTYINGFWASNLHEFWHRDHRVHNFVVHGGWSPPLAEDPDGDGMCSREPGDPPGHTTGIEATIGSNPMVAESTEVGANWAETNGTYGLDAMDWAYNGSQCP